MADYFTPSGDPALSSSGSSSVMRAVIAAIAAGFAKIAGYTGNSNKIVVVNAGGTALEAVTTLLAALTFSNAIVFSTSLRVGSYNTLTETLTNNVTNGSAQTIFDLTGTASAVVSISGIDGGGHIFHDVVAVLSTNNPVTISQQDGGTPGTRTYTQDSTALKLNPSVTQTRVRVTVLARNSHAA